MTREKKMRKFLKQKMSPEMRALNDELHINAHVLLDVFKDLNYSGTGLVIVDGFLHVYERTTHLDKIYGKQESTLRRIPRSIRTWRERRRKWAVAEERRGHREFL